MRDVWFRIPTDHRTDLLVELKVPESPTGFINQLRLFIDINDQHKLKELNPGTQTLRLSLEKNFENRVALRFEGGFAEPGGARTLYAQIGSRRLEVVEH